jgi:hypothetical protein
MPEHVFMSGMEIITDGGRRRRWTAAETFRLVAETLEAGILREALDKSPSRNRPGSRGRR